MLHMFILNHIVALTHCWKPLFLHVLCRITWTCFSDKGFGSHCSKGLCPTPVNLLCTASCRFFYCYLSFCEINPDLCFAPFRLALYVYEYLLHIGAQKSAQTFLSEVCETCGKSSSMLRRFLHSKIYGNTLSMLWTSTCRLWNSHVCRSDGKKTLHLENLRDSCTLGGGKKLS